MNIYSNKTINETFQIDTTRNGGFDFQFDEVVRDKQQRKAMQADDCECCRNYYEAVGPLPERLQPPPWRSPTSTPKKSRQTCNHKAAAATGGSSKKEPKAANKKQHKQAISRHRHHWARAETPPGYWDIGFPDTQETKMINEKAKEMHERKWANIEAEAARTAGKYLKRR
ncbi:hypothetical protein FISHEDRAFT_50942 [Fistulina hepatica ATCC 64428]|uniref:DNA endonuclease activator Ctp1 C-terminal domain-containing protein n=1 Tax=Fistulina hepatica ATCC 64428 TaxID=1128425 RepID=A0A0D7A0Q1_9AGAR|nr:hypothetical protein FISHEDRAFT_50942 [Fistulina hepatica ATCC 64428]